MDSVVNAVTISPGKAASIARRRYLHLLRNETQADDENRDALSLTAHVLGRSAEQVASDVKIVRRVKQLEDLVNERSNTRFQANQAAIKLEAFDAESSRLQTERLEKRKQIATDSVVARDRATEAKNAELELEQLRNSNPELLA